MSTHLIDRLIENFSINNLISFLGSKLSGFQGQSEGYSHFLTNNQRAKYSDVYKIGETTINDSEFIIAIVAKTIDPLTERSGKKTQYDIAKTILKDERADLAFFVFYDADGSFRFSIIDVERENNQSQYSTYKRYSYYVSKEQTNKTFRSQVGNANFASIDEIVNAFSVAPLNEEFYKEINKAFYQLIGGDTGAGRNKQTYKAVLRLPSIPLSNRKKYQEFSVRLIGRIIFCWFLKNKKSDKKIPLIPSSWLTSEKVKSTFQYYHNFLEKIFFELLNKEKKDRRGVNLPEGSDTVPFLNGGLFDPQPEDYYRLGSSGESEYINTLKIPDSWIQELFETLERYNFTIDENTINDTEVSIDPEMLGTIFENLLAEIDPDTEKSARKSTGSFYTPREIVDYMVEQSLMAYLKSKTDVDDELLKKLFTHNVDETLTTNEKISLLQALYDVKILDPACGSGAFPIGCLNKIVDLLQVLDKDASWWREKQILGVDNAITRNELAEKLNNSNNDYARKLGVIQNSIYGVDIQELAVEISKLRCFLSLVIDETIDEAKDNRGIYALPNLEFKFVAANTLVRLEKTQQTTIFGADDLKLQQLEVFRKKYLQSSGSEKEKIKNDFSQLQTEILTKELKNLQYSKENKRTIQLSSWQPFSNKATDWFDPQWMFGVGAFNIVIGNPPYISTKGTSAELKKMLEKNYGFADDTYNHFFFKGIALLKEGGNLTYITPKTFWTTQTKRNLRDLLLSKQIRYIFDTANPFKAAMVDTCIISVVNNSYVDNTIPFLDGSKDLINPINYNVKQSIYLSAQNKVIFKPTEGNMKIFSLYGHKVKELYNRWWDKISTSKNIEKNKKELDEYRKNLKPGDIALLGCLTEGGQGLATANNGKYIAVRRSTRWADKIIVSRPKKLDEAINRFDIEIDGIKQFSNTADYLNSLTEVQIVDLFDSLKEQYGRDIFGQGYIYRVVDDGEIANVDALSEDEKENGIEIIKKYYVPYDKGDKDGNRWYLETPFAIAWSKENVRFFKTNSGKKGEGMPVIRNPQFYFKEGFCWTDVNSTYLKARLKKCSVFDVLSMSLFTQVEIPDWYFVSMINSRFISLYVDNFINNTSHFQINDARQLPIIIPSSQNLKAFEALFNNAIEIKNAQFSDDISNEEAESKLSEIQEQVDELVVTLYQLS